MDFSALLRKPLYTFVGAIALAAVAIAFFVNATGESDVESGVYRVVNVTKKGKQGGLSWGTGFKVADPGVVVTNYHVIRNADDLYVLYRRQNQIEKIPMRIMWHDKEQDLAILRGLSPVPGAVLTLADISEPQLHKRDEVEAIGFPGAADSLATVSSKGKLTLENATAVMTDATVSTGTVQRQVPGSTRLTIQHSANVNSGNSGGPLLDSCQRVVGVNTLSQVAEFNLGDISNAMKQDGVVRFQTPGSLESSVHVREVLAALKEENVAPRTSSGRCHSGKTSSELWALGTMSTLSLALFSLTGLSVVLRDRNRGGAGNRSLHEEMDGGEYAKGFTEVVADAEGAAFTEVAPGESIDLVRRTDGASFALAPFLDLLDGTGIVLGRAGGDADVAIDDGTISRRHAVIRRHLAGDLTIADLESTNGTSVDGRQLKAGQSRPLYDGSEISLGSCVLVVRLAAARANGSAPNAGTPGASGWILSGFDGDGKVFQLPISASDAGPVAGDYVELATLGRAGDNDCVLNHPSISRRHAAIVLDANRRLCLVDLGSSNGTSADGRPVGARPVVIEGARELRFGEVTASLSQAQ